jgi:hypothetical protein
VGKYKSSDLGKKHSGAYKAYYKDGAPSTCYDAAVFSLTQTGDLKEAVWRAWRLDGPKADTHLVVDPLRDTRLMSAAAIPVDSLVAFYRRMRRGENSAIESERKTRWVLYHIVRSMSTPGDVQVVGSNNGDRAGTNPLWSSNDVTRMFDWTGTDDKGSIYLGADLPADGTYGAGGKEQYVPVTATSATVAARLNRAYPGAAAFG